MKVLCVCPIGIGNYLMFYPACRVLKRLEPHWSLHLLGLREGIRDFARGDPLWDGVHVFDPTQMKGKPLRRAGVIAELRKERFDASINFFPGNKWMYNALPVLAGISRRYGFDYPYHPVHTLPFLLTSRAPVDKSAHDVRNNLAVVAFVTGKRPGTVEYEFPSLCDEADLDWARQFLRRHDVRNAVAVHPGSSADHGMAAKRWPASRFGYLADKLCRRLDAAALLVGGPDENGLKRAVAEAMSEKHMVVEPVSLRRTAALLCLSRLAVCNDSGLMHIASCQDVPTVGIFGPTDERRNAPMGRRSLVVRKPMKGFPIWTTENVGNRAVPPDVDPSASLRALSVEEAWQRIGPWLDRALEPSDSA
ncbi:MAG: hypothetical protein GF344_13165 [Chitinivibrionales bacterium]|nr:hypothetical protein [Chitinivibrionales bacterium]MBD3357683.1 hypothetical protein [Chitinivibrionales bacterium]